MPPNRESWKKASVGPPPRAGEPPRRRAARRWRVGLQLSPTESARLGTSTALLRPPPRGTARGEPRDRSRLTSRERGRRRGPKPISALRGRPRRASPEPERPVARVLQRDVEADVRRNRGEHPVEPGYRLPAFEHRRARDRRGVGLSHNAVGVGERRLVSRQQETPRPAPARGSHRFLRPQPVLREPPAQQSGPDP